MGGLSYSNLQYSTYRLSIKCVASDGEAMTKLLEVDVIPNAPPDILNWPGGNLVIITVDAIYVVGDDDDAHHHHHHHHHPIQYREHHHHRLHHHHRYYYQL